jgi:hypothetical protein
MGIPDIEAKRLDGVQEKRERSENTTVLVALQSVTAQ